jgi:hypothetical protein
MRQEIRKSCPIWDKKSEHQFVSSALGPEIREVLSFVQMAADGRSSRNKKWGGHGEKNLSTLKQCWIYV